MLCPKGCVLLLIVFISKFADSSQEHGGVDELRFVLISFAVYQRKYKNN